MREFSQVQIICEPHYLRLSVLITGLIAAREELNSCHSSLQFKVDDLEEKEKGM